MRSEWSSVHVPLRVAAIFSDRAGKFDSGAQNMVLADYSTFMAHMAGTRPLSLSLSMVCGADGSAGHISPNATDSFRSNVASVRLMDYAQQVGSLCRLCRLPACADGAAADHLEPACAPHQRVRGRGRRRRAGARHPVHVGGASTGHGFWVAADCGRQALFRTGFTDVSVSTPVLARLRSLSFFSLFLGLIMSIIVVVLSFLSITLVYSLLMINVETRTFEMGVLRMVGLQRNELVQLLMTQALLYALPAIVGGLILAQVLMGLASRMLASVVGVAVPAPLNRDAAIIALVMGVRPCCVAGSLVCSHARGSLRCPCLRRCSPFGLRSA
jgi:hypothetical protein